MRRTIAGTAFSLVTALAIGAPLAGSSAAAPTTLRCGSGATAAECKLLDDLAAQLGPVAPLLGTALAPLTSQAEDLAARSDSAAGVPTAEVVDVSEALLAQLGALPAPVEALVGPTRLGDLTDTLHALVGELTAPSAPEQQSTSGGTATPARATSSPATSLGGARAAEADSSSGGAVAPGGSTSSDRVPAVPVGDPLALAPLALPDFGFDTSFTAEPSPVEVVAAPTEQEVELAAITDAMGRDGGRNAELAVAGLLSVTLLAGAGIAQLQANRRTIPD
jgi:hypothetical protein